MIPTIYPLILFIIYYLLFIIKYLLNIIVEYETPARVEQQRIQESVHKLEAPPSRYRRKRFKGNKMPPGATFYHRIFGRADAGAYDVHLYDTTPHSHMEVCITIIMIDIVDIN